MTTPYEKLRLKRIAENKKKVEALNLHILSKSLHKTSEPSSKPSPSVKVRPRFVQPGELEVNKKRLRSTTMRKSSITPPPIETTTNSPPIQTTITPPPIQTTKDVVVGDGTEDDVVGDGSEDDMVGDEVEDDVVGDEAEDIVVGDRDEDVVVGDEGEHVVVEDATKAVVKKAKSVYWDVNVINEEGHVSSTRLCVKDLVANSEPNGTWIILEFNKDHCAIGQASGLLAWYLGVIIRMFKDIPIMFESWKDIPDETKTKFYDSKIKRHFLVDDGRDKEFVLASAAKKWKEGRHLLFRKFYKWDLTLEENLQKFPTCGGGIPEHEWAVFVQYRRKEKTQKIAQKKAQNRAKLKAPHTLGSKSLARKKHELELRDGRTYNRGEMYAISHQKSDGSFVNEDAYNNNEKLQVAIKESVSENEAFQKVFGKEKHGYVRSMGLGVTPSQINRSTRPASSAESEKIKELQEEINALKEKNSKIDELMEAVAFLRQRDNARKEEIELLMQMQNSSGRQGVESPADGRRSSESSYRIEDNGSARRTN